MPRALTDAEQRRARERLHRRGRALFVRFGLTKTTVAALAAEAGIAKGSFYRFYDSKEALFLAISESEEREFRSRLADELDACADGRTAIEALLRAPSERLDRHPFLRLLLEQETLAALALRVGHDTLDRSQDVDRAFFVELAERWIARGWLRPDLEPREVVDVLTGLFLVALQRELVGAEVTERATTAIARSLAQSWSPVIGSTEPVALPAGRADRAQPRPRRRP